MNAQLGARAIAVGRAAIGGSLLLAPKVAARGWIGDELSARPGVQALVRSLGVRDLVIGLIAFHTADHPEVGPRWQRTCAAVDLVDALATVAGARELPRNGVVGVAAVAGGTALAELLLARAL